MPDRLKDSDFLKCPLDVSELISSSMNNPSIKGLSELHRKQWYNMLPYFRGLYIRFYDFVYAKAILAVFSLIFSLQTRSSLPSCTLPLTNPDQKIICFSYCFSCFRAQKSRTWTIISEPAGLVRTWSKCLSDRWNSWQLSTVSQLMTQRVRVYCAVWPSKSQCVCVCVCLCVCDTSETWVARKHFITAILFTCTHFFLSNTHPHVQPTFPSYASVLFTQWHIYTIVYVSIVFLIIITQSHFITVNIYFLSHDRNLIKTSWNNLEAAANTHTYTGNAINHSRQNGSNEVASC